MSQRLVVREFSPVSQTTTPSASTGSLNVAPNISVPNIAIETEVGSSTKYFLIPESYAVQFSPNAVCVPNIFYNLPPVQFVRHNNFIVEVKDFLAIFGYLCSLVTVNFNLTASSSSPPNFELQMTIISTYNVNDDPKVVANLYSQTFTFTQQRQSFFMKFPFYDPKVKCFQMLEQEILVILPFSPNAMGQIVVSSGEIANVAFFYNLSKPPTGLIPYLQTLSTQFPNIISSNYTRLGSPFVGYVDLLFTYSQNSSNPVRASGQASLGTLIQ